MTFDALIIGSELDGWVAAASLLERGHSVCVAAPGEGSLHYAPGGVHVLGHVNGGEADHVEMPLQSMSDLDLRHPYRLAGDGKVRAALDWFAASPLGIGFRQNRAPERNSLAVTPAGLTLPVLRAGNHQATADRIAGKRIAILRLRGHRDFPVGLVSAELVRRGERVVTVEVDPPDGRTASVAIAQALDAPTCRASWLAGLKTALPADAEVLLVPAVLGHNRHHDVMAMAAQMLGLPVLEVPTLPPCLPGMRLAAACERHVRRQSGTLRIGCRVAGMSSDADRVRAVTDANGRVIEARTVILATGGVLMGGLDVDSHGDIREPALGLDVHQTAPLSKTGSEAAVDALHRAGIETDDSFRPRHDGSRAWRNLFVTGRNLAHWSPGAEISAEGVAIVSGWVAAEAVHDALEGGS